MNRRPRTEYFKRASKQFKEEGKAADAPCWICGQPIDYDAEPRTPNAHSLDHLHPYSTHPELHDDPANWRHAHDRCNKQRGNRPPTQPCETLPRWW